MQKTRPVSASFVVSLGSVVALGPFAVDTYLVSLPSISAEFNSPDWATQLTLTGYLLVLGFGQLIAGPLSDRFGRRAPMLVGLVLFIASSLLAMLAPAMSVLIAARLIQGAGGSIMFVAAYSSVRDRTTGDEATKIFAALMSVSMIAPIIAPVVGGFIEEWFGWRAVFATLALLGVVALVVTLLFLPESLPVEARRGANPRLFAQGYASLLRTVPFLLPLLALCGAFLFLFAYLGGASYVYQAFFDITQAEFGIIFGFSAAISIIGSVAANRLALSVGSKNLAIAGALIMVAGAAGAVVLVMSSGSLWFIALALGVACLGLGLAEPPLMAFAMSSVEDVIGSGAALIGAAQYILGAAITIAIIPSTTEGPLAWTLVMLALTLGTLAAVGIVLRNVARRTNAS